MEKYKSPHLYDDEFEDNIDDIVETMYGYKQLAREEAEFEEKEREEKARFEKYMKENVVEGEIQISEIKGLGKVEEALRYMIMNDSVFHKIAQEVCKMLDENTGYNVNDKNRELDLVDKYYDCENYDKDYKKDGSYAMRFGELIAPEFFVYSNLHDEELPLEYIRVDGKASPYWRDGKSEMKITYRLDKENLHRLEEFLSAARKVFVLVEKEKTDDKKKELVNLTPDEKPKDKNQTLKK